MTIFDDLINKTKKLLPSSFITFDYSNNYKKRVINKDELIFKKETAFELGGENLDSVAYTLFTEDNNLVNDDKIFVYGKDLKDIKSDTNFLRIILVKTKDAYIHGEQAAYSILETINLKRYDIKLKGYMIRTSVLSNREQVRVSKEAIKSKLSFQDIGSMYIDEYKKNKYVEAVNVIFVTLDNINYKDFEDISNLSTKLFRALNHAIADLKMDCKHCDWKLLCDQIEGMKELHKKILKDNEVKNE